jgi:hypothetical protein
VPQRLDLGDLREEAMPANVETPSVTFDGTADPAHHVVGLEYLDGGVPLGQLVRRGQASRAGSDDYGVGCCHASIHHLRRVAGNYPTEDGRNLARFNTSSPFSPPGRRDPGNGGTSGGGEVTAAWP